MEGSSYFSLTMMNGSRPLSLSVSPKAVKRAPFLSQNEKEKGNLLFVFFVSRTKALQFFFSGSSGSRFVSEMVRIFLFLMVQAGSKWHTQSFPRTVEIILHYSCPRAGENRHYISFFFYVDESGVLFEGKIVA